MKKYIMKKYAMSERGATDYIKAVASCACSNIILMTPAWLFFLLIQDVINGIIPISHYYLYGVGGGLILELMVVTQMVQYKYTFEKTYGESATRRLTLAESIRKLPLSFFGKRDLSDMTSVIMNDCTVLESAFSHFYSALAGAMISTSIMALSLFVFDPIMALSALWVLPIAFAIVFFSKKVQESLGKRQIKYKLECADGIQEYLETTRELKSNNAEEKYLVGLEAKICNVEKYAIFLEFGLATFVVSAQLILKLGIATVAVVGSVRLISGDLNLISFILFLLVVSRLYDPLSGVLMNLAAVISSNLNLARAKEISDHPMQTGSTELAVKGYDVEFSNVGFCYNDDVKVLRDVSFTAKQGEITALIGPSGGGKSTIAKLAARFWDINHGCIKIGGQDISKVDPETLLSCYSIVFQDVALFNNTVMENIRIGKRGATDEEVLIAARKAQCDEFVLNMAEGFNTLIGENGTKLSGGERQRISIARAILKDAQVILLDEATASLDAENETQIQEALSGLIKDKTVMIIAHRMRTVENADKIVVLDCGSVVEQGSPQKLIERGGKFAEMLKLQKASSQWSL